MATELAVFVGRRCNCTFSSTLITGAHFTCPPPPHPKHVTYRANVALTGQPNRTLLEAVLREWPAIHRAILIQGGLLSVDDTCPVIISSFHEEECVHDETVPVNLVTESPTNVHIPFLTSTVLAVAMAILTAVVIVVLSLCVLKYKKVIKRYVFPQ